MADSTSTSSGCLPHFKGFSTAVIHDGQEPEKWNSHAVVPPISMATTFKQDGPGQTRVCAYFYKNIMLYENGHDEFGQKS